MINLIILIQFSFNPLLVKLVSIEKHSSARTSVREVTRGTTYTEAVQVDLYWNSTSQWSPVTVSENQRYQQIQYHDLTGQEL